MRRILPCCLLLCAIPLTALATPERVADIVQDIHARGYPSASAALTRLQQASDVPTATAPLPQRLAYATELWPLQMVAGRSADLASTLAQLQHMAATESCSACAFELELQRAFSVMNGVSGIAARRHLDKARSLLPAGDSARRQHFLAAEAEHAALASQYTRSLQAIVRAANIAAAAGKLADKLIYQNLMVSVNSDRGDLDRALDMAKSTLAAATALDFQPVIARISVDLGRIFALKQQRESQRVALERALAIASRSPELRDVEIMSINNLADYYLAEPGGDQRAFDMAQRAYGLTRGTASERSEAVALANMGIAATRLGRESEGINWLRQAIEISERHHIEVYVAGISQELVKIYQQQGRYREALLLLQKVNGLQEKVARRERQVAVLDLQEKYAAAGRNQEIRRLSAENAQRAAEVAIKASQQRLGSVVAVMLAFVLLLLVIVIRRMRMLNRRLAVANGTLTRQSMTDPLTGAFNRRHCQKILARLQHATPHRRHGDETAPGEVGLLLLDVDFFKHANDAYGHAAGDAVLVAIVQRLQALMRESDIVARWGGEEFLLVLPHASLEGIPASAQRVLEAIGGSPVLFNHTPITVTASIGGVFLPALGDCDWETALGVADLALYQSKAGGRNRATCVMRVDTDPEALGSDLMQAQAAGKVKLQIVPGPSSIRRVIGPTGAAGHAGAVEAGDEALLCDTRD